MASNTAERSSEGEERHAIATILSAFLNSSILAAVTSVTAGSDCLWRRKLNGDAKKKYSNNVLDHVADDAVCLSGTTVVAGLSFPENLQSAEDPNINEKNNKCLRE